MATLHVSFLAGSQYRVAHGPSGSVALTTGGTSTRTTTNNGSTIAVVYGDVAHYVTVGASGSVVAAATNSIYVPANVEREIALAPDQEVAAITA